MGNRLNTRAFRCIDIKLDNRLQAKFIACSQIHLAATRKTYGHISTIHIHFQHSDFIKLIITLQKELKTRLVYVTLIFHGRGQTQKTAPVTKPPAHRSNIIFQNTLIKSQLFQLLEGSLPKKTQNQRPLFLLPKADHKPKPVAPITIGPSTNG